EVEVADALVALALGATDDPVGDLPHPSGELPQTLSRELHGLPREADEVRGVRVVDDDALGALGERLHGESHRELEHRAGPAVRGPPHLSGGGRDESGASVQERHERARHRGAHEDRVLGDPDRSLMASAGVQVRHLAVEADGRAVDLDVAEELLERAAAEVHIADAEYAVPSRFPESVLDEDLHDGLDEARVDGLDGPLESIERAISRMADERDVGHGLLLFSWTHEKAPTSPVGGERGRQSTGRGVA